MLLKIVVRIRLTVYFSSYGGNPQKVPKMGGMRKNVELGPGVFLSIVELCRGYRCGRRNKKEIGSTCERVRGILVQPGFWFGDQIYRASER